ncbi:MAG: WD40 repeat domain-containing protein [Thermoguttaceae bacterium]
MTKWRLLAAIAAIVAYSIYVGISWGADPTAGQVPVRIIEINKSPSVEKIPVISGVAVDRTGKMLATVGDDHLLRIWSLDDGTVLYRLAAHTDWIKSVTFRSDGKAVATAGNDRRIRIWDLTTAGQPAELPEEPQAIRALVYSPDGKLLASAGFGDKVRLYTTDGRLPRELDGPGSELMALAFSPDGAQLAAAGRAGTIRLWNTASGSTTGEIRASTRLISALAYSPGGSQLAAAGDDRAIRIFDPISAKVLIALPQRPGKIRALEFCGEKLLAAGDTDNVIRLWNLSSKAEENQLLGHTGTVAALAYNTQTGTLISGSFDTTVRAWKISSKREGISQR